MCSVRDILGERLAVLEISWGERLGSAELIAFPQHALLIVAERLREQQAEGVRMPEGIELDELALRILVAAETGQIPHLS